MGTFLGLDFGQKRVGVAVSDETKMIATPLKTLSFQGRRQLWSELEGLIREYQVEAVVVGLPKTMNNEVGPAAEKVQEHVEWFSGQSETPWVFWDERLTTREAESVLLEADVSRKKRKEVIDQLAAQRILQGYLDKKNYEKS